MSQYVLCSKSLASTRLHMFFSVSCLNLGSHWPSAPRYTLQGIPLGLGQVLPLILKDRGATFTELGVFSLQLAWGGSNAHPQELEILVVSVFWGYPKSWMVNGKSY